MIARTLFQPLLLLACCIAPGWGFADTATDPSTIVKQAGFVDDTGAANRIEAGDALRVFSQEVPAAVCHLHNGVAADLSAELLVGSVENFDLMLGALVSGDEAFGIIGGEERAKTVRLLNDLQSSWEPMRAAALAVRSEPSNSQAVSVVYALASDLLDKTYVLSSELEAQYSNPVELLYEDALLLEVSGRQALLSQRISYLACRKWSGSANDEYVDHLRTASGQYDFAMQAMLSGAPELGIKPPPTEDIASALQVVAGDTDLIRSKMASLFETGTMDGTTAADLYVILADKMEKMEEIAHLYAEYSKRVY